jgi:ribose/xylose/arabinose/galactoside ABC-type transport system permease subunit
MDLLGRGLMTLGVVFVAVGFLLWLSPQIPLLGKLPGDLRIERPGFVLYLPITSCLVVSAVVSLAAALVGRLR